LTRSTGPLDAAPKTWRVHAWGDLGEEIQPDPLVVARSRQISLGLAVDLDDSRLVEPDSAEGERVHLRLGQRLYHSGEVGILEVGAGQ
jgi:hypothetical protein